MKLNYLYLLLASLLIFSSCGDDDDEVMVMEPVPTGNSVTYGLGPFAVEGISGTAEFVENDDASITVNLSLVGTPSGGQHPAHVHLNTAAEGGGIAVTLGTVDGSTGESSINITTLDDGTPISYSEILEYDGYINVHLSADDLGTIVAQGDIGQNAFTGTSKTYTLGEKDVEGISGSVTFNERLNGEALAVISLGGTPEGGSHPAHIHINTAAEGGGIAYSFNPVDGLSGISRSNVAALDDGTSFGYADVIAYDGYINVHLSADDLATIVAQGDIGENELTGTSTTYALGEKDVTGISGSVTFSRRANGEVLAVLSLTGTPEGGSHPAHIHMNSAAEGGGIVYTFTPVDGTSGTSVSNIAALDDGTSFGYTELIAYDGYINVHLSADDLATIVAQGDIGSNAG